ncbi:MAG: HNH endonuclease signature motif containing protein [Bacillota bacterium]
MGISERTRKILWARSGNRCAICRCELVRKEFATDPAAVIGDECHIISKRPGGPRYDPKAEVKLDGYDNLILLCKTHHKLVDDQPSRFTVEYLRMVKAYHEKWVRETLGQPAKKKAPRGPTLDEVNVLPRIRTGRELVNVLWNAHLFYFDNDELESEEELDLVSGFFQVIQDYGDLLTDLGAGEVVKAEFYLNQEIKELESKGFFVFGRCWFKKVKIGNQEDLWPVASVRVVRRTSPEIVKVPNLEKATS